MIHSGNISGPVIILGDLHFGIKQANIGFYEKTQLTFFRDLLIPYMLKNNIKYILQLGDFLDNRTSLDTRLWDRIKKDIFDELIVKNDIKIITILGNHDIAYRNHLDCSFMYTIEKMYKDNVRLISTPSTISINNKKYLFQPWLTPDENVDSTSILNSDYILGHFETTGFMMVKGHNCNNGINPKSFSPKNIKAVYSGHFHIRSSKGKIHYVGTPYQLSFGDYDLKNGFVVHNSSGASGKDKFIENNVSSKFIKIKYNDENKDPLEVSGLYKSKKYFNLENIPFKDLKNHNIKFFINKAKNSNFEEYIYVLKQAQIEFEIINNVEISNLIGTDYINEVQDVDIIDTKNFILNTIKTHEVNKESNLEFLLLDIIKEVEQEEVINDN